MRHYQYKPLEADEIRLLELQSGDFDAELKGSLLIFKLPEDDEPRCGHEILLMRDGGPDTPNAPNYDALSYTWGESARSRLFLNIMDDGKLSQMDIKPNLDGALRRLRQDIPHGESRMLWIDAICINQSDIPEKSTQIQKMAMIYNRAESVSVWLGGEDKDSNRAIEFIEKLLKLDDFDPLTRDPGAPAEWAALMNLMQRPWFNRRWIVQEISLARRATLFCGPQSVSWQDFSAAVSLFVSRYQDLRPLFQSSKDFQHHPNFLGEVDALGAKSLVDITNNLFRKSDEGVVLERLLSLEALISTMTAFEASSPHDTIYAVLWLAYDAEPDSKDSAAMCQDEVLRTPVQSPTIDMFPSQDEGVFRFGDDLVESPKSVTYRTPFPGRGANDSAPAPRAPAAQRRTGRTLLKPPTGPVRSFSARSASDRCLRIAENQFEDDPQPIVVDYEKEIYDVCRQFLEFAISRSKSLDIICQPWAPEPQRHEPQLPSWISQLSGAPFDKKPGQNCYGRVLADPLVGSSGHGPRNYNASGKTKIYPNKDFINGRTLLVTGFVLDAISVRKGPALEGIIPSSWLDLVGWSGPPDPVPDRFWRTLVADRGPGGHKYPPAYYPLACKWVFEQRSRRGNINTSELLTFGRCPSIAMEFLRRVQSVVWGRRLILTAGRRGSKQLLALAPAEVEEGDLICIIYGCSVPVVLRRRKKRKADDTPSLSREETSTSSLQDYSPRNQDQYSFVGQCYVHGMMAGEGFKHQREHGNKLKVFHLV
ncbi:HET-domain-containing protein [Lepidopterella palustris CBS 459.81]|uniref:HET-domain-containing protein n=1 Tax=Lepidopterella palustris CBS 459.81 TaxID=1314670 RepID=A0A8E2EDS5_9PEZI|nr:HET-domain-containing protein [Lepidopterella palustris CBS 459.81]